MSNNRIVWLSPSDPHDAFPPVDAALSEPDGLLAAGGDLSTERLISAYRLGIFPWYSEGQPLLWWSPNPRCVFRKGELYLSRRQQRYVRQSSAEVRFNTAFSDVIAACAAPRAAEQGTWITSEMIDAYERMHREGWAHSVEIWQSEELVGGLYGLAIGRAFFGESMFSAEPNASKFALLVLSQLLDSDALGILDCQMVSRHLVDLGASSIPREAFMAILASLCERASRFENWPSGPILVKHLLRT